jgi:hypothetical protein
MDVRLKQAINDQNEQPIRTALSSRSVAIPQQPEKDGSQIDVADL